MFLSPQPSAIFFHDGMFMSPIPWPSFLVCHLFNNNNNCFILIMNHLLFSSLSLSISSLLSLSLLSLLFILYLSVLQKPIIFRKCFINHQRTVLDEAYGYPWQFIVKCRFCLNYLAREVCWPKGQQIFQLLDAEIVVIP